MFIDFWFFSLTNDIDKKKFYSILHVTMTIGPSVYCWDWDEIGSYEWKKMIKFFAFRYNLFYMKEDSH